jgi:hypothetical protein
MLGSAGNPVEEHIADAVPVLVELEFAYGRAEWTATVIGVDIARDRDSGVTDRGEHRKKGLVGALAGATGDVEHDQSYLSS